MSKCNRCGHICHCGLEDDHKIILNCDCIGCNCGSIKDNKNKEIIIDDTIECESCQ